MQNIKYSVGYLQTGAKMILNTSTVNAIKIVTEQNTWTSITLYQQA